MKETLRADCGGGVILRPVRVIFTSDENFWRVFRIEVLPIQPPRSWHAVCGDFGETRDQCWILTLDFTPKKVACRHSELEEVVLPLLRGRVFHVTTEEAFNDICRGGWIESQRQVQFFFSPARSARCYGRNRRWVSVYDLSNGPELEIKKALTGYWLFRNFRIEHTYVFLIVVESAWPSLISWKHASRELGGKELFVPFVEAWYPGNMSIELFSESLAVSVHPSLAVI